jgi:hypothetical protein
MIFRFFWQGDGLRSHIPVRLDAVSSYQSGRIPAASQARLWHLDRITVFRLKFCLQRASSSSTGLAVFQDVLGGTAALRVFSGVGGGTSF